MKIVTTVPSAFLFLMPATVISSQEKFDYFLFRNSLKDCNRSSSRGRNDRFSRFTFFRPISRTADVEVKPVSSRKTLFFSKSMSLSDIHASAVTFRRSFTSEFLFSEIFLSLLKLNTQCLQI